MAPRTVTRPRESDHPAPAPEADGARLNERIARALTQAIADGAHPVGASLPPEAALCTAFGASRFTVREALRKLAETGLIETRQGAGSRVVSRLPRAGYQHVYKDLEDLFEYARDTRFEIAEIGMAALDAADAVDVGAPDGSRWLRIAGTRYDAARTRPISYVIVFVHGRFAGLLEDVRDAKGAIWRVVESRSGEQVAEAVQQISAAVMPAVPARALGLGRAATAMKFVRRYCDASGGVMLTSVNWHPADRFSYTMRIRRGDRQAG